jgi:hypothetical protein
MLVCYVLFPEDMSSGMDIVPIIVSNRVKSLGEFFGLVWVLAKGLWGHNFENLNG